jgi:hypothetical protein
MDVFFEERQSMYRAESTRGEADCGVNSEAWRPEGDPSLPRSKGPAEADVIHSNEHFKASLFAPGPNTIRSALVNLG